MIDQYGFDNGFDKPRKEKIRKSLKKIRRKMLIECNECFWCGIELTETTATVDHYIPLSRGGSNARENLKLACLSCNNKRGNRMPDARTSTD